MTKTKAKSKSKYIDSRQKRFFDLVVSITLIITLSPVIILISLLILIFSGRPILFFQRRVGRGGHIFTIYKFRTMYDGADADQKKYQHLNQADGPVFKIRNDPRFVGVGKWLSNTGLDELPQFFNVVKGDMSIVGPRPLPAAEDAALSDQIRQWRHHLVPGMISNWVILGGHKISFDEWMAIDKTYYQRAEIISDVMLFVRVIRQQLKLLLTS